MKKFALTALAAAAALTAVPLTASAQPHGRVDNRWQGVWEYRHDWDRGFNINRMQQMLDRRLEMGIRRGLLTRNEARRLETEFRNIAALETRYRRNGLNRKERDDLERRLVAFERRLDHELRDGQYYAYRR